MTMTIVFAFAIIFGAFFLVIFSVFREYKKEKKRTAELEQLADDLGMSFSRKADKSLRKRLKHIELFRISPHGRFKNVSHEDKNNGEMVFFDYKYRSAGPRSSNSKPTSNQSIFYFRSSTLNLPSFSLQQVEQMIQNFMDLAGYKDINFKSHPVFSNKYLLNGEDEEALGELFNKNLLSFLEEQDGISIEGGGDQLIFYRPDIRVKPEEAKQFIQEGIQILEQFSGSAFGHSD